MKIKTINNINLSKLTSLRIIILILICAICTQTKSFAQNEVADSLKNILSQNPNDTLRVNTLNYLSKATRYEDPNKAIDYCNESIALAKKIGFQKGLAEAYYQMSYAYSAKNDGLDSATYFVNEAIEIAEKNKDYSLLSGCYSQLSTLHKSLDDKTNAAFKAVEYADKSDNKIQKISALHNLGLTFHLAGQLDDALKYYLQSETLSKEVGYLVELKGTYNNIAIIYSDKNDFETALHYKKEALKLCDKVNHPILWARNASNLSGGFIDMELYDSAKIYLQEAEQIFLKYDSPYAKYLYETKGYLYYKMEDYKTALPILLQSFNLLKNNANNASYQALCEAISDCYYQIGNLEKANQYKDTLLTFYKQTYLDGLTEELAEANIKYETELKEKQISDQSLEIQIQKNKRKNTILIGFGLISLLLIAFQYYFQKQKRKKLAAEHDLEIQQAETASLKNLDTLKTQFFTNISHELRTPLTLISGPLENALAKTDNTSVEKDINTAYKQTNKLTNLVNELLDFSKLESGKLEVIPRKVQLSYFIKRIFYAFESMADLRKITLIDKINIDENLWVLIDDNKVEKILNNLLSNALKFTRKKGNVTLKAFIKSENVYFEVIDTGDGIHPNDIPHIFERFYQSKQTSETLLGGTGIGLALCKELTKLMNGSIAVKSTIGEGSSFSVVLPFEKTVANTDEQSELMLEKETKLQPFTPLFINGEQPKILIVEDNYEMSRYLNEMLSENYNCTVAFDGEEALKKIKQQSFDLISCDIMMPNMDGFTFRTEVNKLDAYKNVPFIMLTARAIEEDKLRGLRLGVDDYILKPFNQLELEARIHNLLQNKIQREEIINDKVQSEETPNVEISFLQEAEKIVLNNISNTNFKIADLAEQLNYSPRHLSRILKKASGLSPVAFILEVRLQKARQLLEQQKFNSVKEVQFEIGIDSASYFTTKFKERFGKSPSSYL